MDPERSSSDGGAPIPRPPQEEPRVSLVSSIDPQNPNINSSSGRGNSQTRRTEKAPLLSQRNLFRSLGGFANGLTSRFNSAENSSGTGYQEFGNSSSTGDITISFQSRASSNEDQSSSTRTLDTFAGVFCPVTLSMFSALLFLRVGFIVGNAGLVEALVQFAIAYAILLFTVFSICAISTNGAVEGGGAYFMISRTLGPELGGAIGSLFIFANIVSSALYITGCVEGIVDNFGTHGYYIGSGNGGLPNTPWWRFFYCSGINFINLTVCLIGASLFAKTSVLVLGIVGVCLFSVIASYFQPGPIEIQLPEGNTLENGTFNFTGFSSETFNDNLWSSYGPDYTSTDDASIHVTFAIVFGVLFSGVTGVMAGANMSGELKSPGRSIPRGTVSAVGFTFLIYALLALLTSATCSRGLLQNNYIFMMPLNFWGPFVTIGILTATFSASLSNLIGSSRVLEAVAKDDIFGSFLSFVTKGTTSSGNPVMAVFTCFVIVELFLLIGSLNVIAQLNSVLFLLSYFAMNLACLGLELSSAPNFRPAFRYFSWHTALLGIIGTMTMMFLINAIYAALAIIFCLVLVILLHLFTPSRAESWGSISQALIFHQVRKYLLLLDSRKDHVKFWRPHMLLLVSNPRGAAPLIDFVNDMKKSGLYVLGHVEIGDLDSASTDPIISDYSQWLSLVDHLKVKAFIELTQARSIREGVQQLVRISGLGAMRPNTIVLGFYDDAAPIDFFNGNEWSPTMYKTDRFPTGFRLRRNSMDTRLQIEEYVDIIKDIIKMNKNICICRNFAALDKGIIGKNKKMFIDIWPINFFSGDPNSLMDPTSLFLLQLGCILNMVSTWRNMTLRVFLCCTSTTTETASVAREQELKRMLQILRIKARIVVVPWDSVLSKQNPEVLPDHLPNAMEESAPQWSISTIKSEYLQGVNSMIREHSFSSALSYLYLPEPPIGSNEYRNYFLKLSLLTEGLGPTLLVYGTSPVTSTTI